MPRDRDGHDAVRAQGNDSTTGGPNRSTDNHRGGTLGSLREQRRGTEPFRPKEEDRDRKLDRSRDENRERGHRGRLRISPRDRTGERSGTREGGSEESLESFWDCYRVPNWERPGGELEDSYCRYSRRERDRTDPDWSKDTRSGELRSSGTTEGATSWETGEQAERVEEDWGRQTCEPWYKSSMERSPIPNLTRGEKTQTGVSGNNRDNKQLFIPLRGGIEGWSGETHTGVGGEVVQSDIYGPEEEQKVEEDSGLQNFKRGSARETLQDGFPGDSCGTPGGERLDDYARHIECLSTCQNGRAIQSLSVLQLSESMLRLRGDAIWSKGRAQSIHEDNETSSVIYQRTLEGKAGDISGRHPPHAPRQGCIEIDLTGDSPVPEKSGLDTVGGEAEARTRKEFGVFGMELELREDGSDAPREEESAAPGGCEEMVSTCKEKEETKDEGLSSTPREVEFCEVTTPTSELVDEAHAIRTEAGNSPRGLERNCDSQSNDVRRINTLEENPAREQTKESEEKEQTSRANDGRFRAGMGCSINNTNKEQRGEDICPWELDPPGECVSDKRKGVQSSVEDFRKKRSMAATAEDRPYSSEDRQYVHKMDNTEEEWSSIAHSNTESIGEETEQPGHYDTDGTSPGRAEHGSRCTQPDGEEAGLCTDLAGADLDPAAAAWAFDKDPGDHSGVHDTGNEDEKGRLEITPRRGNKRYTGEENIQGRDLFLTWGEHVGAKDIAAAILRNQKSERDTWRALRRFKQFLDRESMDDTDPLTTKDAKWIMAEFIETLSNTNLSSGVINQTERKVLDSINLFRKTKVDVKDIEIFQKTYVGEKPRRGNRYKSMWDLTIITKWEEATHDMKDPQTLQRRALILTLIFGALRPAELERMRRGITILRDDLVQTQVQTKTSGGETVKVIINKHPNPRIDAVVALQRWMDYIKTTFRDEHVWFDLRGRQPANLQRIKEELVAVLRENGIPDTFTAYSIRHAVITHLARQQAADWKAINAYARWAPGSRVAQEYYTVLPVQDTRWILETIGGPVPLAEKGGKSEKDSKGKEISNENTESETKEYPEETSQSGGEAETSKRKNSKRRGSTLEKSSHHEDDITQPTRGDETPSIIPRSIMELTEGRQTALLKKLETNRRKRGEKSIEQMVKTAETS
ncbi:uncharacterized protein MONOS_5863 [Monocercomonoides exilis]|uniref:uncharacterized protein n=1 Tax=Monocercomonoides exilis TaxID=2049356 RepID=UPI00355A5C96|nr:hypothetical protein MONOS_5863 [Monocercomonoides exilis]|eukprot:MONOS_5863.1-p1 / transcript=MONOS_5863.1 / gene=MONOS_5863 / organism=Monocercomonoides_exilis_PA203 / gene_product=unspecified product / transcript_product=unspecified product / location=Mono_scaffold00176:45331-49019(+) / protein_length=1148 / sequence_SO=supercontig / SO=protein_coding / is_pseudo=false